MKTFEIEINELLSRVLEVKADNEDEAQSIVEKMYKDEDIVLDSSDFIESSIQIKPIA
ncbi:MAG: DpnD/PcfM family protein [Mariprofundaceae bacterium]|nr:DpnD/PcfM family protein [Mariprofundaceae bacterium]